MNSNAEMAGKILLGNFLGVFWATSNLSIQHSRSTDSNKRLLHMLLQATISSSHINTKSTIQNCISHSDTVISIGLMMASQWCDFTQH